jgi:hypothetical protein
MRVILITAMLFALSGCGSESPAGSPDVEAGPDATPDAVADLVISDGDGDGDGDAETETELPAPVEVARATCEAPVGGHVVLSTETAFEAIPGYDAELAALDLESLPEVLDLASLAINVRSLVAYMLHITLAELPEDLTANEIAQVEPMGAAVLGAFAVAAAADAPGLDLPFLRRGLHRFYQCDRAFPLALEDFRLAIYDYGSDPFYEVMSVPKNDIRRIRESEEAGVYVAETWIAGEIRETEILLSHSRSDGALDFIVYDQDGNLMDRSEFVTASSATIGGASPYGCIACHFAGGSFEINVLFPDMDPVVPPRENP